MSKKNILLTICITTFNRPEITALLISKLPYHASVEYIVINDGSSKKASDYLKEFINSNNYPIHLFHKSNGGKLSAVRYSLQFAKGEYYMDLDSDDGFTKDCLLNILEALKEVQRRKKQGENIIGITGLCSNINKEIIGDKFPTATYITNYLKMRLDDKIKGDKEEIILTDILKKLTIPEYPRENRIPTSVQWFSLGANKCLFVNKIFSQKNIHDTDRISSRDTFLICLLNDIRFAKR